MSKDKKNQVVIFDTTLRDGEQCPGATMNIHEKLEVAKQLARLGADVIEAGFPIASPGDFEAVNKIAETISGPVICALARLKEVDIETAGKSLAPAARKRIHTFSSGSDIHLRNMMKMTREKNIERSVTAVKLARTFTDDVEYSAQDTTRSDREYLAELYTAVAEAGATTLNIPDTVGYAIPDEFGELVAFLVDRVKVKGVVFSVHCHNDLGLAVANSLAAVKAGARQIECTINGIGERAGNCSLEEAVMAIRTRSDALGGLWTGVNTKEIMRSSRLVSRMTGFVVQRNKAIVGANAFAHESGIHQDGMLKDRQTYEIMVPEDVGLTGTELVLGKHSGRHALGKHLEKMGFSLSEPELDTAYARFKELCDKKKVVYDDDLVAIVQEQAAEVPQVWTLDYMQVTTGTQNVPTATVRLRHGERVVTDAACGDGPVEAILMVIDRISGVSGKLEDFSLQAITKGEDAVGEVSVRVRFESDAIQAKGSSTDIVEAAAKAYLNALNRYLFLKSRRGQKKTPERGIAQV
ncbi:MAG: 2-isopropylmalate synthase [Kiritimatiellae bacterium]|nr:2-isopropylmalate synthase [Kiritimatiellia bacterium]MCO5060480.1 2-isopropylmalate synthase [Kiritimatiellia bacterium]MCO6400677.1 2-isopropylmalate synthase [Verrucomicrobiota bacterium]